MGNHWSCWPACAVRSTGKPRILAAKTVVNEHDDVDVFFDIVVGKTHHPAIPGPVRPKDPGHTRAPGRAKPLAVIISLSRHCRLLVVDQLA